VLYVGYPCNIRCKFCYYTFSPSKKWRSIKDTKADAKLFRDRFDQDRVDITGGEPTIYPSIYELVSYCRQIGLRPSLITNTQILKSKEVVQKFADHGLFDFLCSVHAIGEKYNDITQTGKDGWGNLVKAVDNLNHQGIPWRANCTLNRHVLSQLKDIAKFVFEHEGRVINFISFNPFYNWEQRGAVDFQARHTEIRPYLIEALDYCNKVGLEANVRYMPFCMLRGHEEKCYNFQQISYDSHEWNYNTWSFTERGLFDKKTRWLWRLTAGLSMKWVGKVIGEETVLRLWAKKNKAMLYKKGEACGKCGPGKICDHFTKQYADKYGFDEAEPYADIKTNDPVHFISNQEKVVD